MSNLTDFFPSGGGGGLTPKFQEFNSSGTFTPSQALIDAGGYVEVFLVGGGAGAGNSTLKGSTGGEALMKKMYLLNTNGCAVTIGSGGGSAATPGAGGDSTFDASSSGSVLVTAKGGIVDGNQSQMISPSWGSAGQNQDRTSVSGNGVFGYGAGAKGYANEAGGVSSAKANSGQGGSYYGTGGSGYCLIKWYE